MLPFRSTLVLLLVVNFLTGDMWAQSKPSFSGIQFPVGQPADHPVARVSIQEVRQTAHKSGFLRIAFIPCVAAQGVKIRFARPEINVLLEVPDTLKSITQLEAQEFRHVEIFTLEETTPRLTVEEILLKHDVWTLKNLRYQANADLSGVVSVQECQLVFGAGTDGSLVTHGEKKAFKTLREILGIRGPDQNLAPPSTTPLTEPFQPLFHP
jgi:hypothetical protein